MSRKTQEYTFLYASAFFAASGDLLLFYFSSTLQACDMLEFIETKLKRQN